MNISIDDMKSCVQEWYSQATSYEELFEIDFAVKSEANKQAIFIAECIAKEVTSDVQRL